MKVVAPSYEILKDLDEQSLAIRIEVCGRLCYKSEDKITPESAPSFISKILKHGHNSVTEMAVLTLKIHFDSESIVTQLFAAQPKYFQLNRINKKTLLMSGSVRAFRELFLDHGTLKIVKAITLPSIHKFLVRWAHKDVFTTVFLFRFFYQGFSFYFEVVIQCFRECFVQLIFNGHYNCTDHCHLSR